MISVVLQRQFLVRDVVSMSVELTEIVVLMKNLSHSFFSAVIVEGICLHKGLQLQELTEAIEENTDIDGSGRLLLPQFYSLLYIVKTLYRKSFSPNSR